MATNAVFSQIPFGIIEPGEDRARGRSSNVPTRKWTSSDGSVLTSNGPVLHHGVRGMPQSSSQIRQAKIREFKQGEVKKSIDYHMQMAGVNPSAPFAPRAGAIPFHPTTAPLPPGTAPSLYPAPGHEPRPTAPPGRTVLPGPQLGPLESTSTTASVAAQKSEYLSRESFLRSIQSNPDQPPVSHMDTKHSVPAPPPPPPPPPPPIPPYDISTAPLHGDPAENEERSNVDDEPMCPYTIHVDQIVKELKSKRRQFMDRRQVRTNLEAAIRPTESSMSEGEKRFRKFLRAPTLIAMENGITLDPVQHKFIEAFQFACAPRVYGADWESDKIKFYQTYKLDRIHYQVLCMSPRRFGKTWSIALFCLSLIWTVPNIIVNVFSTNQRTSNSICRLIRKWMFKLADGKARSANDAKSEVWVIPDYAINTHRTMSEKRQHGEKSCVIALPSTTIGTSIHSLSRAHVCVYKHKKTSRGSRPHIVVRGATCRCLLPSRVLLVWKNDCITRV